MAQVCVAATASDFRSAHQPTIVRVKTNVLLSGRLPKARPTRVGIEFGFGVKERLAAAEASIDAVFFGVPISAAEGPFGSLLAGDPKLFGRQHLSPFHVALINFVVHISVLLQSHSKCLHMRKKGIQFSELEKD